ncbi:MAG TPA: DNA primase [Clostridiaceae bacterium]|nr:DNA primase [Clostridiaceae bacterium]
MYIQEDKVEKIRESNDIVDVISDYVSLQKKGKNYFGLCPFHKEKTPSFSVLQDKQIFHCFGCGAGGNVISFIMKYRNVDFIEAVKILAERANIDIYEGNDYNYQLKKENKEKVYEVIKEAARFFYRNLQKDQSALHYFKNRGISSDIVKKFGLGYALNSWDSLNKYLTDKGYKTDLMEKAGLIIKKSDGKYYDRFRNRVMFPVFNVGGKIIGFGGRVLDDSKPKYLNSPETIVFNKRNNLYALNIAVSGGNDRRIIIVEGYMDAIALHQYGIKSVVASLGTSLTKEQAKLLKRYCDEVLICYDSDVAGQTATLRGLDILTDAGFKVKIICIPKGKDPDEYIRAEGKDAFLKCIEGAMPLIEYKIKREAEKFDISTTEGKIGFTNSCARIIKETNNPVVIDAYVSKVSLDTGISAQALYDEIARAETADGAHDKKDSGYNYDIDGQKLYLEAAYIKAERFILYILYSRREFFSLIEKRLSWEDFNDETYKKTAEIMYRFIKNGKSIVPGEIIDSFKNDDEMKKVSSIFSMELADDSNLEKMINDYIDLIDKTKLKKIKTDLMQKMKVYEKEGDVRKSAELLKKIIDIEKQLKVR